MIYILLASLSIFIARAKGSSTQIDFDQAGEIALKAKPGQVLNSELKIENGLRLYRIEIVDRTGKTSIVLVNADTAEIIQRRGIK